MPYRTAVGESVVVGPDGIGFDSDRYRQTTVRKRCACVSRAISGDLWFPTGQPPTGVSTDSDCGCSSVSR
ncbi:hypothetical protein C476_09938 [Natrinema limicola JCM 13563]|uniref:Uncharacterized protein n=1 Tax=Natrinema limicola JCM 13563 TaxID=1230457 RepID=M0CF12_9EURY|nr:hypothetical protein C476_09938 [Natrinema limicola JCM 13563]